MNTTNYVEMESIVDATGNWTPKFAEFLDKIKSVLSLKNYDYNSWTAWFAHSDAKAIESTVHYWFDKLTEFRDRDCVYKSITVDVDVDQIKSMWRSLYGQLNVLAYIIEKPQDRFFSTHSVNAFGDIQTHEHSYYDWYPRMRQYRLSIYFTCESDEFKLIPMFEEVAEMSN